MATHGKRDLQADAPVFTTNAVTGESGQDEYGTRVFAVDATEAQVVGKGVAPGWVRVTTGTGGRAGRVTYETIAAMNQVIGDAADAADDEVFPNTAE